MNGEEDMGKANESNTSSGCSVVSPPGNEIVMDYTSVFTTKQFFESRDHLINWVRNVAHAHDMMVVVKRSDTGGGRKKPRLFLGCERSGQYRRFKSKLFRGLVDNMEVQDEERSKKKRRTGTKKCDCPFLLRGREISVDVWGLEVECGVHNHPTAQHLIGHPRARRVPHAEEELVIDTSNSTSRPNVNESHMQYLLGKVKEHGYFNQHRRCKESDAITDIFFAHPTSVDLLRAFPRVLWMDCTYKTNKCKLPLLEIVGVTSTGITFQVAYAYMASERDDNYIWACNILKSLMDQSYLPNVIVTDRETALMNAVETYFPTSRHLLCRWQISKSIMTNCKKMFRAKEKWESFNASWGLLVYADTESKFYELLKRFQGDYAEYPAAIEYVMNQWIEPYKERFVSAWTNNIMHFNNTTTVRAESHHSILKKQLATSMGNFEACWTKIHTLLETSHNAIKASFEVSSNVVQHRYKSNVFKSLRGVVSADALSKIYDEMRGIPDGGIDHLLCGCVLRMTCGLPCAHEIADFVRDDKPIPLDMIDSFWRKLNMMPTTRVDDIDSRWTEAIDNLSSIFARTSESEKLLMLKRLTEVVNAHRI